MSDLAIYFEELQKAIEKKHWHEAGAIIRKIETTYQCGFTQFEDLFIDWKNANKVAA